MGLRREYPISDSQWPSKARASLRLALLIDRRRFLHAILIRDALRSQNALWLASMHRFFMN